MLHMLATGHLLVYILALMLETVMVCDACAGDQSAPPQPQQQGRVSDGAISIGAKSNAHPGEVPGTSPTVPDVVVIVTAGGHAPSHPLQCLMPAVHVPHFEVADARVMLQVLRQQRDQKRRAKGRTSTTRGPQGAPYDCLAALTGLAGYV